MLFLCEWWRCNMTRSASGRFKKHFEPNIFLFCSLLCYDALFFYWKKVCITNHDYSFFFLYAYMPCFMLCAKLSQWCLAIVHEVEHICTNHIHSIRVSASPLLSCLQGKLWPLQKSGYYLELLSLRNQHNGHGFSFNAKKPNGTVHMKQKPNPTVYELSSHLNQTI